MPLPEPLVTTLPALAMPVVIVIQLALHTAVQLHPLDDVTLTLPDPPEALKDWLVGEIEYVQLCPD